MLAAKVASGELPPVEERLPEKPFVLVPIDEIGKYGGTLRTFNTNPNSWGDLQEAPETGNFLVRVLQDGSIVPDIVESYDYAEDGTSITLYFRKGMKWSDGAPLTGDDLMFGINDIHAHDQLPSWGTGSISALHDTLVQIDQYTVRVEFAEPKLRALAGISDYGGGDWGALQPKHYFSPWHIDYNDKADEIAKEEGFEAWHELISWSLPFGGIQKDLTRPTTQPWIMTQHTGDLKVWERNPYYFVVDTAGNQLPYIDEKWTQVVDAEAYHLKIAAGEADWAYSHTTLDNFTLYKENEAAGGYKVNLIPGNSSSVGAFRFNPLHPDPNKAKVLSDVRFPRALSLAINRDEINDILFNGRAVPHNAPELPKASYYKEEWGQDYIQYDPAGANRLLDEMGLDKKGSDGFRIGFDGRTLQFGIEYYSVDPKLLELVKEYWEDVGVKTDLVYEERSLWRTRRQASEYSIMVEGDGGSVEVGGVRTASLGLTVLYWQPWSQWVNADYNIRTGKETLEDDHDGVMPGLEPPQWVKDVDEAGRNANKAVLYSAEYTRWAQRAFDIGLMEHRLWVGTVGMPPVILITNANLGNVPRASGARFGHDTYNWAGNQLFFKNQ
jgi:peptide/nickel transport system substrate-binding protein